jgi:hypothetical protein
MPHTLLVPTISPRRFSALGAILNFWLAHLLATPHIHMLRAVIILGDFLVIPFLIPTAIFLDFDAIEKNRTDAHLVVFILSALLTKPSLMHTLLNSLCVSFGAQKNME